MTHHALKGLVVVSNRLPFTLSRDEDGKLTRTSCAGGLVTGVAPAVTQNGGVWVGWPGILLDEQEEIPEWDDPEVQHTTNLRSSNIYAVNIDNVTFDSYYNGFCNSCLWPLFHSMPEKASFEQEHWLSYKECNVEFSNKTVQVLSDYTDVYKEQGAVTVWIHDYHLLLAPKIVKDGVKDFTFTCRIAFFLHIPFPTWDIFRLVPWGEEMILGILHADLVGFHIKDYCMNFLECCSRGFGLKINRTHMLVKVNDKVIRVHALPIGIPYQSFHKNALSEDSVLKQNECVILGVDRMDYTKGLPNKLLAIETFLKRYPDFLERLVFVQIAVPTRSNVQEYIDLKQELERLAGRINGKYSTPTWCPIRLIFKMVHQSDLATMYRDASVMMVTPLRDGMNLVAKEFCACQTKNPPGVLILSPFAGAAEAMPEALFLNPYHYEQGADVIHKALTMDACERSQRMEKLREQVKKFDVVNWAKQFVKTLESLTANERECTENIAKEEE